MISGIQLASQNARCDYALFMGASNTNAADIPLLAQSTVALKMYLNDTYTSLRLDDFNVWAQVIFLVDMPRDHLLILLLFKLWLRSIQTSQPYYLLISVSLCSALPKLAKGHSYMRACRATDTGFCTVASFTVPTSNPCLSCCTQGGNSDD